MAEAATVEASRAKRIERLKSRYRDRGGIFVPATHNPLLDILLSRGVDGESPSKARRRASRRSFVAIRESPTPGHRTGPDVDEDVVGDVPARSAKPKGKGRKSAGTIAQARRKSTAKERKESVAVPEAEPSAGPSHTSPLEPDTKQQEVAEDARLKNGAVSAKPSTRRPAVKGTRAKKQAPPSNEKPPPKKRAVKKQSRVADEVVADASDEEPPKRTTVSKTTAQRKARPAKKPPEPESGDDSDDVPLVTKSKARNKIVKAADPPPVSTSVNGSRKGKKVVSNSRKGDDDGESKAVAKKASSSAPPKPRQTTKRKLPIAPPSEENYEPDDPPPATSKRRNLPVLSETDDEPEQRKPSSAPPKKRKLPVIPEENEESEREGSHPVKTKKRRPSTSGSAIMPNSGRTGRPAQDDDPEPRENASGGSASGSANREKGGRVITTDAETLSTNKVVKQANTRRSKPKPRAPSPHEDDASSSDVPLCTIRQLAEAKTHKPSRTQADPEPRKRTKMKQNEVPEGVLADVAVQPPGSRKRKTAEGEDASRAKKPKKDTGKPKPEDAYKSKVRPADKENDVASSNKLSKGTVRKYKPQPKPRLSMFPTPPNVANDDDDPIDFLS